MDSHVGSNRFALLISLSALLVAFVAPIPAFGESPQAPPTITDDDDDDVDALIWINDVEVNESDATATFTISKLGNTSKRIEIEVATADIEAAAGLDYVEQKETIKLPRRRVASVTFTVPLIDDQVDEDLETFAVKLASSDEVHFAKDVGIASIVDDDTAGVHVDEGDGVFVEEGGTADSFSLRLRSEPASDVVISVVADSSQVTTTPEQVVFDATNWTQEQSVAVSAVLDGLTEDDPHQSEIGLRVASSDRKFDNLDIGPVTATIADARATGVVIVGPSAGIPGRAVSFTADINLAGSEPLAFEWTVFLDGNAIDTGNEQTFTFTPSQAGIHVVRVSVNHETLEFPSNFVELKVLGDVATSTFVEDILWLANKGITRGCNPPANDLFCPEKPIKRGQMAAFLVRFLGLSDTGAADQFIDDNDSIFEDEINILAAAGYTSGCNPPESTLFCPDDLMSRGQMAGFLSRALGLSDDGGGDLFVDDDVWIFEPDIDMLATAGITKGCNPPVNDKFCPGSSVTRGQMAAFLHRAEDLLP